jgi:hypothetical protein
VIVVVVVDSSALTARKVLVFVSTWLVLVRCTPLA